MKRWTINYDPMNNCDCQREESDSGEYVEVSDLPDPERILELLNKIIPLSAIERKREQIVELANLISQLPSKEASHV